MSHDLTLTSSAFDHLASMPAKYTCDGDNCSPPLAISGVDPKAVSLVLIVDDPDVPLYLREDGVWDHWVKFNIPPSLTEIGEGKEPEGCCGIGTGGNLEYSGPCPPDKEHRYIFMLYTLDTMLDLPSGATKDDVKTAMQGHILQKAELIGMYKRPEKAQ